MIELASILAPSMALILSQMMIVFARVGSAIVVLPGIGSAMIPARIRLAVAVCLAAVIAPIGIETKEQISTLLIISEAAIGVFFGLLIRLLAMALQLAGAIAAQSSSLSQIFGGAAGVDPQPAIGHVLSLGGVSLAMGMGLPLYVVGYFAQSYVLLPVGAFLSAQTVAEIGLGRVVDMFELGFALAMPFVVASLLYNVTLGFINKAMPQLMVSFVGAPAITLGGLGLLAIAAPFLLSHWMSAFLDIGFGIAAR